MGLTAVFKMLALLIVVAVWTGTALAQSITYCNSSYVNLRTASLHAKTITSPNYPFTVYDHKTVCLWMIDSSFRLFNAAYVLKVVFNDFELEDKGDTYVGCYDSLKFFDGPLLTSRLLGSYCGTVHPDVIYSTGRYLFVRFGSDASVRERGFSFSYSAVKREEAAGICRSAFLHTDVSRLSGTSGTFFSPDYPVPFPTNRTCTWTITVPAGKIVKLTFENFTIAVERDLWYCTEEWKDYVEIRDGQTSNGKELARYSCSWRATPDVPDVYSSGRYMWVNFHSGPRESVFKRNDKNKGFKAHFEAVDPSDVTSKELCLPGNKYNNFLRLTGDKGTVKSPPHYPPNLNCTWLISVPKGHTVKLTFNRFDLDQSGDCGDYVEIFYGLSAFSERREAFCGYDVSPGTIRSPNQFMTVNFRSDNVYLPQYKGFEATFIAEPDDYIPDDPVDDTPDTQWIAGVIGGIATLTFIMFLMVCIAKKRQAPQREADEARVPMTTNITSASHGTQPSAPSSQAPQDDPSPPPTVGYAPVPTNPPPEYPYPPNSPPPYPGVEGVPQYPPPGQSYPWLQNNSPAQASAPPASP